MPADPITFGASPVSESGVGSPDFPELNLPVWYNGLAPVDASLEEGVTSEGTVSRTLSEEGGYSTVGATSGGGTQARIVFEGAWDVVFLDAFDEGEVPTPACSLVLQIYNAAGTAVEWEAGTSPTHPNPYLMEPENYGAQEIDVIGGAATIGQVEVRVVDKSQTAGDQDSGWMTERLASGGVPAVRGRRARLIRYISPEIGYVVIADGPAGVPRMDASYAAFKFVIKDVRETEREIRAFVEGGTTSVLPRGIVDGFGDEPAVTPLTGVWKNVTGGFGLVDSGNIDLSDYWASAPPGDGTVVVDPAVVVSQSVIDDEFVSEVEEGDFNIMTFTWPNIRILHRKPGEEDFEEQDPSTFQVTSLDPFTIPLVRTAKAQLADGTEVMAAYSIDWSPAQDPAFGDPVNNEEIELIFVHVGEPSEDEPLHLSGMTTGELLRDLYDGVYSEPDPLTGLNVPTGIRYDEDALLAMTDEVYLRVTEPVDNLRDWTESMIYAPTGWVPSLDADLAISPESQEIPASFDGYPILDEDVVEPVPVWNAGEFRVNVLRFVYPRLYRPDSPASDLPSDGFAVREVVVEYRSLDSYTKQEEAVEYDGSAFAAFGDASGAPTVATEQAAALAADRELYVFDRYQYGAQTIEIPVRREEVATLKPGQWVVVSLGWLPDYLTQRRGAVWGGQVVAIHDVDCAWRILLLEEAVPVSLS